MRSRPSEKKLGARWARPGPLERHRAQAARDGRRARAGPSAFEADGAGASLDAAQARPTLNAQLASDAPPLSASSRALPPARRDTLGATERSDASATSSRALPPARRDRRERPAGDRAPSHCASETVVWANGRNRQVERETWLSSTIDASGATRATSRRRPPRASTLDMRRNRTRWGEAPREATSRCSSAPPLFARHQHDTRP